VFAVLPNCVFELRQRRKSRDFKRRQCASVCLFVCLFVRLSRLKRVPVMVARAYYVTHLVRTDLFVVLSDSCFQAVHQPPPCKVTGPIHLRIMLLLGNFCWTLLERLEQQVVLQRRLS